MCVCFLKVVQRCFSFVCVRCLDWCKKGAFWWCFDGFLLVLSGLLMDFSGSLISIPMAISVF